MALSLARIECHYFMNDCFFETDNYLIENVGKIRDIPAVIVQGRYDIVCPMMSAWELHRAWPEAQLQIIPDAGHSISEPGIIDALVTAIKLCNARIIETSENDTSKKNMGTTCVSCLFVERSGQSKAYVAHTGDSRVYLFRDNKLKRITIDHSLVEEYLRMGKITEEELHELEEAASPGAGACAGQFTANTMSLVMEFLGLSPAVFRRQASMYRSYQNYIDSTSSAHPLMTSDVAVRPEAGKGAEIRT